MLMMDVSGKSGLLSARFHTVTCHRRRVTKGGLHLQGKVNALDRRVKCFHKLFYLLKNLLYLNIVILELKCNNLTFNEFCFMCFVRVFVAFSLH
jgi:hypothetical protein